jgi:hypothetical protein
MSYNVILQHPQALRRPDFAFCFYAVYVQRLFSIHVSFFFVVTTRFGLPSSGVQVVAIKESATHCDAVLFILCGRLRLLLVIWVNHLFYLGVLELHVFALLFCFACWLWLSWMFLLGWEFVWWPTTNDRDGRSPLNQLPPQHEHSRQLYLCL